MGASRLFRIVLGVAVGVFIGGLLTDRMVFFVILPVGVVALYIMQFIQLRRSHAVMMNRAELMRTRATGRLPTQPAMQNIRITAPPEVDRAIELGDKLFIGVRRAK